MEKEKMTFTENIEKEKAIDIEYFNISPRKLVFLSIVTFGIYDLYWFYKNWEAVENLEKKNISPLGRAIFSIFFCYQLFKKIFAYAEVKGYKLKYSAGLLTTFYIIIVILSNTSSVIPESGFFYTPTGILLYNLIWYIVSLLSVIPIYIVQKTICYNNKEMKGEVIGKKNTVSEVIIIIIGVICNLIILIKIFIDYLLYFLLFTNII